MASITAPTALATFTHGKASSSRLPHVSLSSVAGSSRLAVAAVHGDGVWTYDVRTLRPTTSFTVPPSTVFASAPASFHVKRADTIEDELERVTIIAVDKGEGVNKGAEGKTLWMWRGEEAGDKTVIHLEDACHSLHTPGGPYPLVAVSTTGSITLFDTALQARRLPHATGPVVAARASREGAELRVILIDQRGHVHVLRVDDTTLRVVSEHSVGEVDDVVRAAISPDGALICVDKIDRVFCADIRSAASTPSLQLAAPAPALLALPSPTHPLALVPAGTSLSLAIPSATLPAVLATTALPHAFGSVTTLAHVSSSGSSHTIAAAIALDGRSIVYIVDVALPAAGVGLNLLLGSRAASASLFQLEQPASLSGKANKMVTAVQAALAAKDVARAEQAWYTWLSGQNKSTTKEAVALPDAVVKRVVEAVFEAAVSGKGEGDERVPSPTGVYAAAIVSSMVERRALQDSMLDGGVVLSGLLPCQDMTNVVALIRTSTSLRSSTLVTVIRDALVRDTAHLPDLLDAVLAAPAPEPSYRVELRRQLNIDQAEQLLGLLAKRAEVLVEAGDGLDTWAANTSGLSNEEAASTSLLTHIAFLLDAHLPALITHEPAADLLARLQAAVEPLLAAQATYRRLRAPVDAALTLVQREQRLAAEAEAARLAAQTRGHKGPRQGPIKKRPTGPLEEMVGKYRLEEWFF